MGDRVEVILPGELPVHYGGHCGLVGTSLVGRPQALLELDWFVPLPSLLYSVLERVHLVLVVRERADHAQLRACSVLLSVAGRRHVFPFLEYVLEQLSREQELLLQVLVCGRVNAVSLLYLAEGDLAFCNH